jgi:3-isopropylmalate dehydrogenase
LAEGALADRVERAVEAVLAQGWRTADLAAVGDTPVGTRAMGDAVIAALRAQAD